MKPILECHGLSKQYNRMSYALQNLNLALEPGQIVGLLGPNGSGKTTLIKLINDLLVPTEGRILIDGRAPGAETKKIVSYLPERSCLDESMRIKRILRYFADFYQDFSTEKADAMLRDLEIDPAARLQDPVQGKPGESAACAGHEPGRTPLCPG